MPIFIRNPDLDRRLDELAAKQPNVIGKAKRTPLAETILLTIVEECERSEDPEAWRKRGHQQSESRIPANRQRPAAGKRGAA